MKSWDPISDRLLALLMATEKSIVLMQTLVPNGNWFRAYCSVESLFADHLRLGVTG